MEPPSRNEAIKAAITLNNFLLSYEKTHPEENVVAQLLTDEEIIESVIGINK
ncbi:hypothetical protein Tco_0388523, partial [Tanacetum coccineum]